MNKYAVIVAGGTGTRMGSTTPKQFLEVGGRPILFYSIKTFLDSFDDLKIILVLPFDYTELGQEIIDAWFDKSRIRITAGGSSRFQSVKNGLSMIEEESVIFVHDGVRCLLTKDLIHRCYNEALKSGTAIPAIPSKDSVRMITEDGNEMMDRNKVMLIQTPQTFHSKILLPAFQIDFKDQFTDEATVVEAYGLKISLVEGEEDNIKITRPIDLQIAEKMIESRNV